MIASYVKSKLEKNIYKNLDTTIRIVSVDRKMYFLKIRLLYE
jgi:hypothetical protein